MATLAKTTNHAYNGKMTYALSGVNYLSFTMAFATTSENGGNIEMVKHTRTMTKMGEPSTYKSTMMMMVTGREVNVALELHFMMDEDADP